MRTKNPIASLHKAKERISKSQFGFFYTDQLLLSIMGREVSRECFDLFWDVCVSSLFMELKY